MKELVSIIIPIYKIEEFMKPCVDSVLKQTYKNLEIILVDDGSPDECPKICDEYAKKDNRINVIHKKNGGLSDARNVGMKQAAGKYLFLLDGDDLILPKTIEMLVENAEKNQAEISVCAFFQFEEKAPREIRGSGSITVCDTEQALAKMMYQKGCSNSAWAKLYRKELFDGIKYPKGELYEDLATTYKIFAKAKKVVLCDKELYGYRQRAGSIIKKKFTEKRLRSLDFAREQTEFIRKNYPKIIKAAQNREFMDYFFIFLELPPKQFPAIEERLKDGMRKYRKMVLFDKESLKKPRLIALCSYLGFWALRPATKLIGGARKINKG